MSGRDDALKRKARQWITALLPRSWAVRLWSGHQYRQYARRHALGPQRPHGLPGELVVSLTSYPPRFPTLHLTLMSLLRQDTPPDRIVLWVARKDEPALPKRVRHLFGRGVELRIADDVRSYKKLVFALSQFPHAYLATADDDIFYKPDWLTLLVAGLSDGRQVITCHRAHRVEEAVGGGLATYANWRWDVDDAQARLPCGDIMPTGVGGILYPPGALDPDASKRELFEEYAPSADDLWFFWCARRAGSAYRKVGPRFEQLGWWSAQEKRLFDENIVSNDAQIERLARRFGNPLTMQVASVPTATANAAAIR